MSRWFLPHVPDILGLLARQADTTVQGMHDFAEWSGGNASSGQAVSNAEHAADEIRRELQLVLRTSFFSPLEPEDVYELSERLDAVLNGAKNAVREADVMGIRPDDALAAMAADLADGVERVREAFLALTKDADAATHAADAAIKAERRLEHTYRAAMSKVMDTTDVRSLIAWREMYRRYSRIGDQLVRVAERVWYSVVKEA